MTGIRIRVEGKVQGVGFRAYAQRCASLLGLRGSVWNCADGAVEAEAAHEKPEVLDAFVRLLREGGPGSVQTVKVQESAPGHASDFSVGPSR